MKSVSKCLTCHVEQAQRILEKFVHNEEEKWVILEKVLEDLSKVRYGLKPIDIAEYIYEKLEKYLKTDDIYFFEKMRSNEIALKLYDTFKLKINDALDPLYEASKLAVAGNLVDFGALPGSIDSLISKVTEYWNEPFSINDFEDFKTSLSQANNLLYLVDNAGEIVFDKLFIDIIKSIYPNLHVAVAVKGKPIINDATFRDALQIGLDKLAQIIDTGLKTAGISITKATDEFRKAFYEYDLVIAKGQGNFEGLSEENRDNLFFALVSKCDVLSKFIGVEKGSKIFMNSKRIRQV
ncbi:damage-control phosphatase ARMT1 family protein [Thermosipho atlanticus]|uniref:Damage-control phosphatase ARMT1-like metal-binding domain-containing protein n=1 Tax=Thermosipho atlanticus DSM 15807 TaxID=1123380 RepID=A0A1M5R3N1_9BACT|nr:ARMT1-like domain-containing protein [Thermosipho atlanticus]SHH21017.1 hypothetical protein SAMN02745199_0322 [Thermosipho atlanticus DSM 15807]